MFIVYKRSNPHFFQTQSDLKSVIEPKSRFYKKGLFSKDSVYPDGFYLANLRFRSFSNPLKKMPSRFGYLVYLEGEYYINRDIYRMLVKNNVTVENMYRYLDVNPEENFGNPIYNFFVDISRYWKSFTIKIFFAMIALFFVSVVFNLLENSLNLSQLTIEWVFITLGVTGAMVLIWAPFYITKTIFSFTNKSKVKQIAQS